MWRNGNPFARLVGMQIGAATMESSMAIPQKLKMYLPFVPPVIILASYSGQEPG